PSGAQLPVPQCASRQGGRSVVSASQITSRALRRTGGAGHPLPRAHRQLPQLSRGTGHGRGLWSGLSNQPVRGWVPRGSRRVVSDGSLIVTLSTTALIVIDMQRDFLDPRGYIGQSGVDVSPLRAPIPNVRRLLEAARGAGIRVIHTREGHRPDLADLNPEKARRAARVGAAIGSRGPLGRLLVRGEPGHAIVDELAPLPSEVVIDKPGFGAFYATDLELVLRAWRITALTLAGVTTDVCVHSTLREAVDRGFECQ